MAQYTKSVVEQFGGEKTTVGWSWRLLVFTSVIFGIALLSYVGMAFGYVPVLERQIADLDARARDLSQRVSADDQKNLAKFYSQLVNLKALLGNHVAGSKFIALVERNTNQNVFYTKVLFTSTDRQAELEGMARNYAELVKQMEAYRQMKEVERFFLVESQIIEGGGIRFKAKLFLAPDAVKAKTL